jgi:hypothetical protein
VQYIQSSGENAEKASLLALAISAPELIGYIAKGQEKVFTETVEENGEVFKALFAPLHQKLYFAGEHATILFDVPGTMEAACESGERIARAILQNQETGRLIFTK